MSCDDCPDPWLMAMEDQVYTMTSSGYGDCRVESVHTITVRSLDTSKPFYVPNAIRPGAAGNDVFTIFAGQDLVNIRFLHIFTRWGDFVTQIDNFSPNGPRGWNGDFNGRPVDPGVFVWYAELEFANGSVQLVKGDVTVMR